MAISTQDNDLKSVECYMKGRRMPEARERWKEKAVRQEEMLEGSEQCAASE